MSIRRRGRRIALIASAGALCAQMGLAQSPRASRDTIEIDFAGQRGAHEYTERRACNPPRRFAVEYGGLQGRARYRAAYGAQAVLGGGISVRRTAITTTDGTVEYERLHGSGIFQVGWAWSRVELVGGLTYMPGFGDDTLALPALTFRAQVRPVQIQVGVLDRALGAPEIGRVEVGLIDPERGSFDLSVALLYFPDGGTRPLYSADARVFVARRVAVGVGIGLSENAMSEPEVHATARLGIALDLPWRAESPFHSPER